MPSTTRTVANIAKGTSIAGIAAVAVNQFVKWNTIFNIRAAQRAMGLIPSANCTLNTTVEELCNFRDFMLEAFETSATMRVATMLTFLIVGITISVAWNCADNNCTSKNNKETKNEITQGKSPTTTAPHTAFYGKTEVDLDSTPVQQKIIDNLNETTPLIDTFMTR